MTWHEQAWVEENSPYDGGAYATHLIIAGIVNPDHDYDLWVKPDKLAKRCHCSVSTLHRHLVQMVKDGYLEVLDQGGGRGKFGHYRFLRKGSQNEGVSDVNPVKPEQETLSNQNPVLFVSKEERKERKTSAPKSFPITAEMRAWAEEAGAGYVSLEEETQQFLDDRAAKGVQYVDWLRGWHTWIRNRVRWDSQNGVATGTAGPAPRRW